MNCRSAQKQTRRKTGGYTLTELVIASGIAAVIVMGIVSISMFSARSFEVLGKYSEMDQQSRFALDILSRDIRRANRIVSCDTNRLILFSSGTLITNSWDPATGLFTRQFPGATLNLLLGCDYLSFQTFKRNPGNDFTFYPTSDPTLAKLVTVTWRASRSIYGRPLSTENLQTATIALRN